jgi:hypothetical protein
MHDDQTVQRFIDLRVQGWVFTRIAQELTCRNWRACDRLLTVTGPAARRRPGVLTQLAEGLRMLVRFHEQHPDWFPPVPKPPAPLDPEWEAALRKAYGPVQAPEPSPKT